MKWGEMMKRMENEQGGKRRRAKRGENRERRDKGLVKFGLFFFFFKMKISK